MSIPEPRAPVRAGTVCAGGRLVTERWAESTLEGLPTDMAMGALVGCTVAEVERDLILKTLNHCRGNRTHAANMLGISVRALRNKLNVYASAGASIPRPGGSEPPAARLTSA